MSKVHPEARDRIADTSGVARVKKSKVRVTQVKDTVGFVVQVELPIEGIRRYYGPLLTLEAAQSLTHIFKLLNSDNVCRIHPLMSPPSESSLPYIDPNQTTINDHIENMTETQAAATTVATFVAKEIVT